MHYQIPIDFIPLNVVVYRYDGSDFIFIDVNRQAEKTEGLKKEALLGNKLCEIFPAVKEFGLYNVLLRVHEQGGHETFDDAHYHDERISGWRKNEVIRLPNGDVMALYEDLTQAKQLEEENRRYLQQIQESEDKFRNIAENALMGIFIYTDHYIYVNDTFASMLGYDKEELYSMKVWEIIETSDQGKVREAAARRLLGEQFPLVYSDIKLVTKSGNIKIMRVSTRTIKYDGQFAEMGAIIDITDIEETKEQLKFLAQAIEQTDDLVKIINTKGEILFVNDSMITHSGYSRSELIGAHTRIFKSGNHDKLFYKNLWNTVVSGKSYRDTFVNKSKDGTTFYEEETITPILNNNGKIEYFVSTGKDISSNVALENALRESEELYHTLFDLSPVGILVIDPDTRKAVQFNSITHKVLGYSAEEFAELHIGDYEVQETQEETAKHIEELKKGNAEVFETQHVTKNGDILDMVISAQLITVKEKPYIFSVYQDITALKQYERSLKTISLRLSLATQAASIGVWDWDIKSDTVTWDDQMYRLFDIDKGTMDNNYMMWRNAVDPNDIAVAEGLLLDSLMGNGEYNTQFWIVTPKNERRFLQAMGKVERDDAGNALRVVGVNWDITKQKEYERFLEISKHEAEKTKISLEKQAKVLEKYAFLDPLTHLANRRKFDKVFDVEWRRASRNHQPLSICMIDIDFFKGYNDTLGHDEGDLCLQQVASAIKKNSLRGGELAARFGGEEFIVLLPHCDEKNAYHTSENIRRLVEKLEIKHPDSKISSVVTVSIGCATYNPPDKALDKKSLIKRADKALYRAKNHGRNKVYVFDKNTFSDIQIMEDS